MRRLLAAVLMAGCVQTAQAADLPDLPFLRGSQDISYGPRPVWQGYYIGGQASYGAIRSNVPSNVNADLQNQFVAPPGLAYNWQPLGTTASERRLGFGGFFGYNSQWDDVVVGVEANYIHSDFKPTVSSVGNTFGPPPALAVATTATSNATYRISDFGSLRVRAGYAIGSFLPYAFVGAGVGSGQLDRSVSATPPPVVAVADSDKTGKLIYGYSAGVGVDMMLLSNLFFRAEYEYQQVTNTYRSTINAARVGLGYKF